MTTQKNTPEQKMALLRPIIMAMLFTPLLYGYLIWKDAAPNPAPPAFSFDIITIFAISCAIFSFIIGNILLKTKAADEDSFHSARFLSLVVRLIFCESIALIGFITFFSTKDFVNYSYFGGAAILLMLVHSQLILFKRYNKNSNKIS